MRRLQPPSEGIPSRFDSGHQLQFRAAFSALSLSRARSPRQSPYGPTARDSLLAIAAVLIAVLALIPQTRKGAAKREPKNGEIIIDLKCDADPMLTALKPVTAELERLAGLLDRIGESLPKARQAQPKQPAQGRKRRKPARA